MAEMVIVKKFLEETLHIPVDSENFAEEGQLPLAILSRYRFEIIRVLETDYVVVTPQNRMDSRTMIRDIHRIEKLLGKRCILSVSENTQWSNQRLIEENIPFIEEGKQIYLPDLGVLLSDHKERKLKDVGQISYLTQKVFLTALYENWSDMSVSKAASRLQVSRMAITMAYDEAEVLGLPYIKKRGNSRCFTANHERKQMWEEILPVLRSPVVKNLRLKELPEHLDTALFSGYSALSGYSLIDDNVYKTYAVLKSDIHKYREYKAVNAGDVPACVIQEMGYLIPGKDEHIHAVDPCSVYLSMREEAEHDPRTSMALDEMMEEYVW